MVPSQPLGYIDQISKVHIIPVDNLSALIKNYGLGDAPTSLSNNMNERKVEICAYRGLFTMGGM